MPSIFTHPRKARTLLGVLLLMYLLLGWIFYANQERFLFRPVTLPPSSSLRIPAPFAEIIIPLNQTDTLHLTRLRTATKPAKGAVLYFHGNRNNIEWYARYGNVFTKNGYEVFMLDYPGYGKSRGALTEKKMYDWADIVYAIARKTYSPVQLIIYGKSLGSGVAAQLAAKRDCQLLVLETPYYDLPAVLSHYAPIYPFHWLLHYQFPTFAYLKNVTAPILILHGTSDGVVAYKNAQRLAKLFKKGDTLVTAQGGSHNDLYQFPLMIDALTKKLQEIDLLRKQ
jgi:alpha-beta hydrolase superfamily lysophospholipase